MFQSEIWLVQLEPIIGNEIGKIRPAIIINNKAIGILKLKIVVPITSWNEAFSNIPWMVKIEPNSENCLKKISAADVFQIRSISTERLIKKIGNVSDLIMLEIIETLNIVVNFDS
jgi:mRNA interferase MazF